MKKQAAIIMALVTLTFASTAQANLSEDYQKTWDKVAEEKAGPYKGLAGRNLAEDGVNLPNGKVRDAKKSELREGIAIMERMLNPAPVVTAAPVAEYVDPAATSSATYSSGAGGSTVQCESGGDYSVYDPTGTYWGGWQFDETTWNAYNVAGGEWGSATPAQQDAAAAAVPYDAWPNC